MRKLTPIIGLFFSSSPTAIIGCVIAIIIYSFKSFKMWSFSHIREKVIKRVSPAFADCYSASAVVMPAAEFGVLTSLDHMLPRAIGWGCRLLPFRMPMLNSGAST